MNDFIKALENAQKMPEPSDNDSPIPDLLRGADLDKTLRTVSPGTQGKIAGATEFDFEYKCARLQIGKQLSGFDNGQAQFEDIDESDRLKEIMDMQLAAKAMITKKTETFLKDGTVVIWIEWLEPKTPLAKKDREYLTHAELFAPELSTSDKDDSDDETASGDEEYD